MTWADMPQKKPWWQMMTNTVAGSQEVEIENQSEYHLRPVELK